MKRRTVLVLSLSLLLARSVSARSSTPKLQEPPQRSRFDEQNLVKIRELLAIVDSPDRAAKLGKRHRSHYPQFSNAELLLSNLGVTKVSSTNSIRSFEKQRSLDFEHGNTVFVDGWIFSRAEISLCCAVSLIADRV